jgi:hypothetical protein
MKVAVTTLIFSIVFGATAFAQSNRPSTANGDIELGRFEMNYDIISAPQPTLAYSSDPSGTSTEVVVWLTSENETVITATTENLSEWKQNDPLYRDATLEYTLEQLGANAYWTSNEMNVSTDDTSTVLFLNDAGDVEMQRDYRLEYNGSNTEVYLAGSN